MRPTALFPRTLLFAWAAALCLATGEVRAEVVEGVAAIVDDEVILLSEVDSAASLMLARVQAQQGSVPPEMVSQARAEALDQLIEARLMRKYAERVNLTVTPEEIDETIAGIAADEGITPEQIYAAAEQEGLSREEYRKELGNQLTQLKVMSGAVRGRIEIPEAEVKALFEERYREVKPGVRARVRQIFIPWPGEEEAVTRDQVRNLAKEIRERAIATGQFAELAQRFSRAPSAAAGGLTTLREGEVTSEIARWVFEPEPGSISPVIENPAGVNLFQVVDRFDPSKVEYEQVADALRAELRDRKLEPEFDRWIADQRKQFYVEIVAPGLK